MNRLLGRERAVQVALSCQSGRSRLEIALRHATLLPNLRPESSQREVLRTGPSRSYMQRLSALPRDQREYVDRMDELYGFLEQSNISSKNIVRLEILAQHVNNDVRHLAMLILEVARVKPHKRRRWEFLAHNHFGLYVRLKELWGDDAPDEVPDFPDLADSDVPF